MTTSWWGLEPPGWGDAPPDEVVECSYCESKCDPDETIWYEGIPFCSEECLEEYKGEEDDYIQSPISA